MELVTVANALKLCSKVVVDIHSRLDALSRSDELRIRIQGRINDLQRVAGELRASGVDSFTVSSRECLQRYEEALGSCQTICDTIHNTGAIKKFVSVHARKEQLHTLEKQLEHACNSLHVALTTTLVAQVQHLQTRVEATAAHPSVGLYYGTSVGDQLPRPFCIETLEVSVEKDLMVVSWADTQNCALEVDRYEVRYDEKAAVVAGTPEQLRNASGESIFSLSLGRPKIRQGQVYTVQVRAVNRQGPGEWSKQMVARFKVSPPNKPRRPSLTVISPTEVQIEVQRLTEKDENGSPVHTCLVEYTCTVDTNASEWQALCYPIKSHRDSDVVKFVIQRLTPGSTYSFRVTMINEAGESPPSITDQVTMTFQTPGPPQDLRVSSKRTD